MVHPMHLHVPAFIIQECIATVPYGLFFQLCRRFAQPIMSGVRVQWQTDLGVLRDFEPPRGLHIGAGGKVGRDGPLVAI